MKRILILSLLLMAIISFPISSEAKPKVKKLPDVLSNNAEYNNKKLKYAYYIPKTTENPTEALVLVPGLRGQGKRMITPEWKKLADEQKWLIIAPTFVFEGEKAFKEQRSYQYPKVWSGEAFNTIFKQLAEEKNIRINSLYMMGFSAGAQFVGRYIFLYPEKVKKAAIISSGGNDVVSRRIPVEIFYGIGEKDTKIRLEAAEKFIQEAKKRGISIVNKTYPKTAHRYTKDMRTDIIEFLRQN